jgi:hypothetical protein
LCHGCVNFISLFIYPGAVGPKEILLVFYLLI